LHVARCTMHDERLGCVLHLACCTLHVACRLLYGVCCLLYVAQCVLSVACCMLHAALVRTAPTTAGELSRFSPSSLPAALTRPNSTPLCSETYIDATCNKQHAPSNMQHTHTRRHTHACWALHASCWVLRAACRVLHASCCAGSSACSHRSGARR
jgi:hypothetical protein